MKKSIEIKDTRSYDILGISTATMCMVHCILFPLLTIIPFGLFDDALVDSLFACVGMFVVSKILMSNTTIVVKVILGISILLIITTVVLEIIFNIHFNFIFIGGIGMITGHILNFKNHKNFVIVQNVEVKK